MCADARLHQKSPSIISQADGSPSDIPLAVLLSSLRNPITNKMKNVISVMESGSIIQPEHPPQDTEFLLPSSFALCTESVDIYIC